MKYNNHSSVNFSCLDENELSELISPEEVLVEMGCSNYNQLMRLKGSSQLDFIEVSDSREILIHKPHITRLKELYKLKLKRGKNMNSKYERSIFKLVYLDVEENTCTGYMMAGELINLTYWSNNEIAFTENVLGKLDKSVNKSLPSLKQLRIKRILNVAELRPAEWDIIETALERIRLLLPTNRNLDETLCLVGVDRAPDIERALKNDILCTEAIDYLGLIKEQVNTAIKELGKQSEYLIAAEIISLRESDRETSMPA